MKSDIRFLVLDVDGTLTDGKIYMGSTGETFKVFDIKDGCGIAVLLPKRNIEPIIISEYNTKYSTNYSLLNCAYMGDDIIDLPCMNAIKNAGGIASCPADAVEEVKSVCSYISKKNAGAGAVRDIIDWLIY